MEAEKQYLSLGMHESQELAQLYLKVGDLYQDMHNYSEAIASYKKAGPMLMNKAESKTLLHLFSQLIHAYLRNGDTQDASDCVHLCLNLIKESDMENHISAAEAYRQIAICYICIQSHQEASDYLNKALSIRLAFHGVEHPDVAILHKELGIVRMFMGNKDSALKCFEYSLSIYKKCYKEVHIDKVEIWTYLVILYLDAPEKRKCDALSLALANLKIVEMNNNQTHPQIAISYTSLGIYYSAVQDYEKCLQFHQLALQVEQEIYGEKHHLIKSTYQHIGNCYNNLNKHQEALISLQQALKIHNSKESNGPDAKICFALGHTYAELNEIREAFEWTLKAHEIVKKSGDKCSGKEKWLLGKLYFRVQEYEKAIQFSLEYLKYTEEKESINSDNVFSASIYHEVGFSYQAIGRHQEAIEFHRKSLNLRIGTQEELHSKVFGLGI